MLRIVLTQSRREDWRHAFLAIAYYAAGALMPVWLSIPVLYLFSQPMGFPTFIDSGQFAIYSAAAFSPILYPLTRQSPGAEKTLYQLVIHICIVLAAGVFVGLTVIDSLDLGHIPINLPFLRASSIIMFLFALGAMFFIELHENVYNEIDVTEERLNRRERLDEEFDRALQSPEE